MGKRSKRFGGDDDAVVIRPAPVPAKRIDKTAEESQTNTSQD